MIYSRDTIVQELMRFFEIWNIDLWWEYRSVTNRSLIEDCSGLRVFGAIRARPILEDKRRVSPESRRAGDQLSHDDPREIFSSFRSLFEPRDIADLGTNFIAVFTACSSKSRPIFQPMIRRPTRRLYYRILPNSKNWRTYGPLFHPHPWRKKERRKKRERKREKQRRSKVERMSERSLFKFKRKRSRGRFLFKRQDNQNKTKKYWVRTI